MEIVYTSIETTAYVVADSLRFTSAISFVLAIVFIVVLIGVTIYKLIEGSIKTPTWFPSVDSSASFLNLFTAVPVLVCAYLCHFNGKQADHPLICRVHLIFHMSIVNFCFSVFHS